MRETNRETKFKFITGTKIWYDLYQEHIVSQLDGTTDDMLFYVRHGTPQLDDPSTLLEIYRVEDVKKPDFNSR